MREVAICLMVLACAPSPTAPAARSHPPSRAAAAPVSSETAEAPAGSGWTDLIARDSVWARPELDRFCEHDAHAYFVRVTPSASYDAPQVPEASGCKPGFVGAPLEVTPTSAPCGAAGVPGRTYCCPATLEAPPGPVTGDGASCETAVMDYLVARGVDPRASESTADATENQHGAILNRGTYLSRCTVHDSDRVQICTAVRQGQVAGVTVCMEASDQEKAECVARGVRALQFPKHDPLDVIHTTFEARP
jgi:hypothetical protein